MGGGEKNSDEKMSAENNFDMSEGACRKRNVWQWRRKLSTVRCFVWTAKRANGNMAKRNLYVKFNILLTSGLICFRKVCIIAN